MKMFRICGYGGGRSALVSRLIEELCFRQISTAVIKFAHKPFDMDKPGSETSNLRQSGCRQTLIANRDRWGLLCETPDLPEPDPVALSRHLDACDLVLAIGFDDVPLPGMEVLRADSSVTPLYQHDKYLTAVVSDSSVRPDTPFCFKHADIENIVDHILVHAVSFCAPTDDRSVSAP